MRPFLAGAAALLATACTFTVGEQHFFHPGPAYSTAPHEVAGATLEDVTLTAADGVTIGGLALRQPDADVEILYFGGNVSHADDMVPALAEVVRGLRVNVTMIDYRGYGRSKGTPTIESMKTDALAGFDSLRARAARKPIVVHGVSLGGFVASYVAANRAVDGLVLESTAPDVASWANNQVPRYAKALVRVKIAPALLAENNVDFVKQYSGPLLLIAGSKDRITPARFLEQLLAASPSADKHLFVANGADHGEALGVAGTRDAYARFLDGIRARRE